MILTVSAFIGRLHPAIVHLPIGILLLAALLQYLSAFKRYRLPDGVLQLIWLLGFISAVLSCVSGYILSGDDQYDTTLVSQHMWMGISVATVSGVITIAVWNRWFPRLMSWAGGTLALLVVIAGHLGGSLTRGPDYLQNALLNESADSVPPAKPITNVQQAKAFADVIQPMFDTKCRSCHGPSRQKGGLRLDDAVRLFAGGRDGAVIRPGNATASEIMKRIMLPPEDDHHMPPRSKPQMSESQTALLGWWIDQGADTVRQVGQLKQDGRIAGYLSALEKSPAAASAPQLVPAGTVPAASPAALQALRNKNILALPLGWQSNWLDVNFINAAFASDSDVSVLLPVKLQIAYLRLGHTRISDKAGPVIGQCPNICVLQLDHTSITDSILPQLASLHQLQALNLVGTRVTAGGLPALKALHSLRNVYLYGTRITASDLHGLQQAFPSTRFDTGGYTIPFRADDTTIVKAPGVSKSKQ